jgi:hypothetical protein
VGWTGRGGGVGLPALEQVPSGLFLASGGDCRSLAFSGLQLHHLTVCLCHCQHSLLCVFLSVSLLLSTPVILAQHLS